MVHVLIDLDSVASIRSNKEDITQSFKDLEQAQVEMAGTAICLLGKKERKVDIEKKIYYYSHAILGFAFPQLQFRERRMAQCVERNSQ
jgi:hypothetical protein